MKQNLLRIGCAAAGLALAAGVFTSCSLLPTPSRPVSHPQQEEEPPKYDASSLRDGRLRLFSSYDSLGGNTILCGDKVVHQSAPGLTRTPPPGGAAASSTGRVRRSTPLTANTISAFPAACSF